MPELVVEPLEARAFAPFGEIMDTRAARVISINQGLAQRFHDLATVDIDGEGRVLVNVFRSAPLPLPHRVTGLERHPLGSQAFLPMRDTRFLVLVARGASRPEPGSLKLFLASGGQGVNFFRNTWHHFLIVLDDTADFLVIDRGGPGDNLEEADLSALDLTIPAPGRMPPSGLAGAGSGAKA
jgi:ureidoglycolate lyase